MNSIWSTTKNCVTFFDRTDETGYVSIGPGPACNSFLGRVGGRQMISLMKNCLQEIGAIQYELLHTLGFYHEHTRSDRDDYLWTKWMNIRPTVIADFKIFSDNKTMKFPYDCDTSTLRMEHACNKHQRTDNDC